MSKRRELHGLVCVFASPVHDRRPRPRTRGARRPSAPGAPDASRRPRCRCRSGSRRRADRRSRRAGRAHRAAAASASPGSRRRSWKRKPLGSAPGTACCGETPRRQVARHAARPAASARAASRATCSRCVRRGGGGTPRTRGAADRQRGDQQELVERRQPRPGQPVSARARQRARRRRCRSAREGERLAVRDRRARVARVRDRDDRCDHGEIARPIPTATCSRTRVMRRGSETERRGDQLVGAAACRVVVRDRHDRDLLGAVLGRDLLDPGAHALGRADDEAAARPRPPTAPRPTRNSSAFSTGGTTPGRPRRSCMIAMRELAARRSASSSVSAQIADTATASAARRARPRARSARDRAPRSRRRPD